MSEQRVDDDDDDDEIWPYSMLIVTPTNLEWSLQRLKVVQSHFTRGKDGQEGPIKSLRFIRVQVH